MNARPDKQGLDGCQAIAPGYGGYALVLRPPRLRLRLRAPRASRLRAHRGSGGE